MNINFRAHAFNLVDSADTSKTVGGITYWWKNVTVDEKDAYLSRANDGSYDNGNWSREYEMVKGATVGWTAEQQNMSLLISLTYCLERLLKLHSIMIIK
ncbi:hypothetical protein I3679_005905 [Proteus mirabilis]|uniref:Uncharacterized protein n=1 Tax=Proteus mirabilis TaxID=584 RepID=A0ABD5LRF3_PROMI